MRKSWIGFGAVSGLAATIAAVPYFIDWNWFNPQLVEAVESATGYEVAVAGDIGFSLLPSPRLSAEGVRVTGFGADRAPLLTADRLSAAVAFLPLLSKRAEVKYVALESPQVRIVSYADGTSNWSDPAAADGSSGGELSIDDFRIENGSFVSVAADGTATTIGDVDMAIKVASRDGPYALDGSLRYGDTPVSLVASYKPGGGVVVDAEVDEGGTVSFNGRLGDAAGSAATPVAGTLSIEGETLGGLLAALSKDGQASRAPAYGEPVSVRAAVRGTSERLWLGDIEGTVAGSALSGDFVVTRGARTSVNGRLALAKLDVAAWMGNDDDSDEPFELPDIDAEVLLRIVETSNGDMRLGTVNAPVTLNDRVLTVGRTTVALPGQGAAAIAGTLDAAGGKPSFRGRFEARLPRTAETLARLGSNGYTSLPPLVAAGSVLYANDVVTLGGLKGAFGGRPLSGSVRYPLDEKAPIDVDLALRSLDMRRLVARTGEAERDAEAKPIRFRASLGEVVTEGGAYRGITAAGSYAGDTVILTQAVVRDALGFGVTAKGTITDMSGDRRADLALGLAGEGVKGAITAKGPLAKLDIGGAVVYAGATIGLDGWVRTEPDAAYELTASAKAPEAGVVLARLQDEPRASKLGLLDLDMRIVGAGDRITVSDIAGKVGAMTLSGEAAINTAGAVPRINAALKASVVPVTALLGDDGTGAAEAARGGARWSAEPLSFDWIRSFDGRIALAAERALYDTYVLERPVLVVVANGGTLAIESFKAGMYGGNLSATGRLASGAAQGLALKLELADVPMEPLLKAAAASAPATGTLDFSGTLTARGSSQRALMASLAGPVRIAASNGVIRKVDLARLDRQMGDLRSVNSFVQFAGAALQGGETAYRTLAAEMNGSGGRFSIEKVTADLDGGRASAKGYVDIGNWYADVNALLTLGSNEDAPSIPATIKGELPAPEVKYSLGPLQAWFGKRLALVGIKAATGGDKIDIGGLLGVGRTPANDTAAAQEGAAPQAKSKTVEEELGGAVAEGLGKLFGRKKAAAPPEPAEDAPLEPADIGDP